MKRENWIGIIAVGGLFMAILIIPTLIVVPFTESGDTAQVRETPQEFQVEDIPSNLSPFSVKVLRESGKVEEVPLEKYVSRVVASEMPANFELEALKAQSLAARTYIIRHLVNGESISESADVTDTVQHQVYKNDEELRQLWQEQYASNMKRINQAVQETSGEIMTYNSEPITAAFFSTSNGFTENAEDYWESEIPYLKSVESPWDETSPKFNDQKIITSVELEAALGISSISNTTLTKTEGNRVDEVHFGDKTFTGREIREAFDLKSSDFSIQQKGDHIIFTTKGYGHGVGMSQYGANGMALSGKSYKDIVKHYYKGIEISPVSTQTASLK
ncbi:stage II sporulation protein D [Halobacillus litoralis]|uniref:stage II sporulation protein D n=1 Tax=Halobacillus litoralis TaxID=45668 RepID=UPI001CD35C52|nr:stage II sporulation protein D [Halobacillus litoralis]MCA0971012.1 stage II sporulation protein D [Halobacillus litoralis]